MSKMGRKPIAFSSAKVEIKGNKVFIDGPNAKFTHELPQVILVALKDNLLSLTIKEDTRENRILWGLHRALLANKISGSEKNFEKKVKIVGLGYRARKEGQKLNFSLGYSHKIEYDLPKEIIVDIDKSGQNLIFKSADKLLLGNVCSDVRKFRPPEPYKGTGIILEGEIIIRKAGKTKAAASS